MVNFTFDSWVGKLNKNLYLVVFPHKCLLSLFTVVRTVNIGTWWLVSQSLLRGLRGVCQKLRYILLGLLGWKTKQDPMSHGTAPQKLIVMIDSIIPIVNISI